MSGSAAASAAREMRLPLRLVREIRPARAVVFRAAARALRPDPERTVDQWADAERQVPAESGSPYPGPWDTARVPYLRDVMRCLSLSHPAGRVTLKKSAQVGGTEGGVNLCGQIIAETPATVLVLLPSQADVKDYVTIKLQPMIDASPSVAKQTKAVKRANGEASTKTFKKFRGGYLQLQGANSSKGLQMRTFRVVIAEEISEYPWDVDGRGDPLELAEARTIAESDRRKIFYCSTPALEGACRVSARYEESSRGRYLVPCPHCGETQPLEWDRLQWTPGEPKTAAYACIACGTLIDHRHKRQMLAFGQWQHERPELINVHAGFSINALYSPFIAWSGLVEKYEEAARAGKLKVFTQQYLGEPWRERGDAPDHEKLHASRSGAYVRGVIPADAFFIFGAADVQGDRLEWAIWAYGAGLTGTLVDAGIIPHGPTEDAAWRELRKITKRQYPDEKGRHWPIDGFGVDSGYHPKPVYHFVRAHGHDGRLFALDGRGDPRLPPLGSASPVEIRSDGKRVGTVKLWPVGTHGLKIDHYSAVRLALEPLPEGTERPRGAIRLGEWVSLEYCAQLCAEYLETVTDRQGAERREWRKVAGVRNEGLDCAVYARALANHYTATLTPQQWAALAAKRSADPARAQGDLLSWWSDLYAVGPGNAGSAAEVGDASGAAEAGEGIAPGGLAGSAASPPHGTQPAPSAPTIAPSAAPAGRRMGGVGRRLA